MSGKIPDPPAYGDDPTLMTRSELDAAREHIRKHIDPHAAGDEEQFTNEGDNDE